MGLFDQANRVSPGCSAFLWVILVILIALLAVGIALRLMKWVIIIIVALVIVGIIRAMTSTRKKDQP